jgi:two-component system response regulator AtoC
MLRPVTEPTGPIRGGALLLVLGGDAERWDRLLEGTEITAVHADLDDAAVHLASGRVDALLLGRGVAAAALVRAARERGVPVLSEDGVGGTVPAPAERDALLHAVRSALVVDYGEDWSPAPAGITLHGESKAMRRVRDLVARSASGTATILIRGETGTGKGLVARAIHAASACARHPFVTIHCAALPDTLLESELFGSEKGAFTGAAQSKGGRVEAARGGTLFLDEIGDITPAVQVKLLRLLQDREYERLGSSRTLRADVRFVAATHRDLDTMVKQGAFREDLFYRLNVVPLWVPPLRARREDVVPLCQLFCARFAEANGRRVRLDDAALARVASRNWPGNVRQLENFVERLVVLATDDTVGVADVDRELSDASPFNTGSFESGGPQSSIATRIATRPEVVPLDEAVRRAERQAILAALTAASGNRSKAARLLGIGRATLYTKLKEHGLP